MRKKAIPLFMDINKPFKYWGFFFYLIQIKPGILHIIFSLFRRP